MRTFIDEQKREWEVAISIPAIKRVKARTGYDIGRITDGGIDGFLEVVGDPVKLADVLFVLCERQARERNMDDEAFGVNLVGDTIQLAADAMYEAFVDFCPSRVRPPLTSLAMKAGEVRTLATTSLSQKTAAFDQIPAEEILRAILSSGATGSPASSALTSVTAG